MTSQANIQPTATREPPVNVAGGTDGRLGMGRTSGYKRYHIPVKEMPPRLRIPHPFHPIVKRRGLATLILREVLEYNVRLLRKPYRKRLLARPCIYGVFSGPFGGFLPRRDQCTGCLRCVQEFPEFCTVRRNQDFLAFADDYWSPPDTSNLQTIGTPYAIVWFEAATGKIQVRGMGYKGLFAGPGWDSMWTDMSEIVRPTRDGVYGREFISTVVDIGRKPAHVSFGQPANSAKPGMKQISIPILFDFLPSTYTNPSITESIIKAATAAETLCILLPEQLPMKMVKDLEHYRFGLLIREQPSPSVSRIIAHASYLEFEPGSVRLSDLRGINTSAPVLCRMPLKEGIAGQMMELIEQGIDGFHLYADYHGRTFDQNKPRFIKDVLHEVHTALVVRGVRNRITIVASGGIILAEHVPKAIISGADAVAVNTTTLVALQCKIKKPWLHAGAGEIEQEKFNPTWGTQRLLNLLGSWHDQLIEVLSAMGMRDVRRLRGDIGRAMYNEELEQEAFTGITRKKEHVSL